jgi:holo-[acyl-carrier protein] synthase
VGIDVVDVARAERMLARQSPRLLERLLTPDEQAYVARARAPARHFAVRLAAKEAVYKALQAFPGSRAIGWREIEVVRRAHGRPAIQLTGTARKVAESLGSYRIHLSLTHSELTAAAVAIVELTDSR